MLTEQNRIDISLFDPEPVVQTADSGDIPPTMRTAVGIGLFGNGNGGEIPPGFREVFWDGDSGDRRRESSGRALLFAAVDQEFRRAGDPDYDGTLYDDLQALDDRFGFFAEYSQLKPSKARARHFMARVEAEGLIKQLKGLSLLEYVGSLPTLRDIFGFLRH